MSSCAADGVTEQKCLKNWWTATVPLSSVATFSVKNVWKSSIIITVSEETTHVFRISPEISGFYHSRTL